MNERQQLLRAQGLCISCGDKSRGINRNTKLPYTLCQVCHEKNLEACKKRRARLSKQAKCIKCGVKVEQANSKSGKPFQYCNRCNAKNRRGMYDRRARYKLEGRCRLCGDPIKKNEHAECRECLDRRNQRRREQRLIGKEI